MSPNTTPSAHSARAARLVPWPGLSASGVRVLDRCDSVTSVVVGATTERSFPSQSPIRIVNRHGAAVVLVNALPPLKVVQLLGNACLSPTTLAPKDPFRSRVEIAPHKLFSLDSVEPHRVTSNDLVGALGAIPAEWFAPSHDVTTRLMFSSRADSFSPANRLHPHYQRASPSVSRASPFASVVCRNHHSFTYAASVA